MGLQLVAVGLLVLTALASLSEAQHQQHGDQNIPWGKPGQTDQTEQTKQGKQLQWRFPALIVVDPPPGVTVDIVIPPPPDSINVRCEEQKVLVEVDMDFFGTGRMINPELLSLGGCPVSMVDNNAKMLFLESDLHGCGSMSHTTDDELIYTFTLLYSPPTEGGTGIVRESPAVVGIECHYPRIHQTMVGPLIPLWTPYSAKRAREEYFLFFMFLMMDDLVTVRETTDFKLGEMIYIQATVLQFYHVPLRVYVDNCVAKPYNEEGSDSSVSYAFIDNHGCMKDAQVTGSSSRFLKRNRDDTISIMLEAFRFADSDQISITCTLKATPVSRPPDSAHKACSYLPGSGWAILEGSDSQCRCCDSTCSGDDGDSDNGKQQGPVSEPGDMWSEATIGPIRVNKKRRN
uniref:Zona pellucida sperm-binding protein 3 n=1 Tax=Engraulis japonicus TaxID=42892 RepID=K4Q0T8_ENGJA|nr:egg envelope protein [Engraulis japonicus]